MTTWVAFAASVWLAAVMPGPATRVADFANVLDSPTQHEIQLLINEVERTTGAELAVVTVPSLQGLTVEEYAHRLFQEWGIGKKGQDNGVLLLVAPTERRVRIEVGYGLEAILPDSLAGAVIREMIPHFKVNDDRQALLTGIRRLAEIIQRGAPAARTTFQTTPFSAHTLVTGFLALFVLVGWGAVGVGMGTKIAFLIFWGALFGGGPLVMVASDLPAIHQIGLWGLGVLAAHGGYRLARHRPYLWRSRGIRPSSADWIWVDPGWGGSGWSGGGFSSGGFGGGTSGGGGASGRW